LLDPSSLTARLMQACPGEFRVRVCGEGWQRPCLDEVRALGMPPGMVGWVREVQLLCDGKPWVFARTVIPVSTLTGAQRRLTRLGNRPLGACLFADPGMTRDEMQLARILPGQEIHARAVQGANDRIGEIWGRRSVFRLAGKPLLVAECFLPAIRNAGKPHG